MKARDLMSASVISVGLNASVVEVAKALVDNRISAVPVLDQAGRLVGVVSEADLLRRMHTVSERHPEWWMSLVAGDEDLDQTVVRFAGLKAADVMTSQVVTVPAEADADEIADLLLRRRLKRVPVTRDGRLVGIISRADVLRGLAGLAGRRN